MSRICRKCIGANDPGRLAAISHGFRRMLMVAEYAFRSMHQSYAEFVGALDNLRVAE